jgi:arabinofuranosyltransferase
MEYRHAAVPSRVKRRTKGPTHRPKEAESTWVRRRLELPLPMSIRPAARAARFISSASDVAFALTGSAFTLVFFANAWVGDDVYISFRTVDNFVHGRGLRWNVVERVQAYTHPLWVLLCSIPYFLTREVFYTVICTSFLVCLAAIFVFRTALAVNDRWRTAVFVLLLLASKSFMDWTTSGLENPLSVFWAVFFVVSFLTTAGAHQITRLWAIASLAYVTRQDTLLLYAPACLASVWHYRREVRLSSLAASLAPAVLWTVFAIIYYGFPFPNTVYAKALVSGIPFDSRLQQGLANIQMMALWDPITPVVLLGFIYLAVRAPSGRWLPLAWGVLAYLLYVILVASSSSTMGLRFFCVPYAIAVTASVIEFEPAEGVVAMVVAVLFIIVTPLSPLRTVGCTWAETHRGLGWKTSAIADMRMLACVSGSAMADFQRDVSLPNHAWLSMGADFRTSSVRVRVGGPTGVPGAIGMFPYAAGPDKTIIDPFGLTDPLMARLPAPIVRKWMPGEIPRHVPDGYVSSFESGANAIADPALHQYYDSLHLIISGPILSAARWREIVAMNLGRRDHLLREYAARGY